MYVCGMVTLYQYVSSAVKQVLNISYSYPFGIYFEILFSLHRSQNNHLINHTKYSGRLNICLVFRRRKGCSDYCGQDEINCFYRRLFRYY